MKKFNAYVEFDDSWYTGRCAELPEAAGNGPTYSECLQSLRESIAAILGVQPSEMADRGRRSEPPFRLLAEADRMEDEIRSVFAKVTRIGGVSWSETVAIEAFGSDTKDGAARAHDTELHWSDLVDDPMWNPRLGVGGWSFIDAIGFRYYLPAAMIRCLRDRYDCGIQFHLELEPSRRPGREFTLEKWSALTDEQCACVARFIRCMMLISKYYDKHWEEALNSHWIQWLRPER